MTGRLWLKQRDNTLADRARGKGLYLAFWRKGFETRYKFFRTIPWISNDFRYLYTTTRWIEANAYLEGW